MDCKECKERFRADKVIEDWCQENSFELGHSVDAMSQAEMKAFVRSTTSAAPPAASSTGRTSASST